MVLFYNKEKYNFYISLTDKKKNSFCFNEQFYFRGNSVNNKIILDNENILVESQKEKKGIFPGNSILLSKTFLKHIFNEKLTFQNFNFKIFFKKNYTINLLKNLIKKKTSLIIIATKKGGVSVFTNGLKGFLPRSHFYQITRKILCLPQYTVYALFFLLNKKNKLVEQNLNVLFVPNFMYKLKFFLQKKTKNFNNKRKKKYRKKTKFNFVFLFSKT